MKRHKVKDIREFDKHSEVYVECGQKFTKCKRDEVKYTEKNSEVTCETCKQLIYGTEPSWDDPVKFSFSHGGKDGIPYPVDRKTMDNTINILRNAVDNARIGENDRLRAIRKLNEFAFIKL